MGNITVGNLIMAVIVLAVGLVLAKIAVSIFKRSLKKTKLPGLIMDFLARFLEVLLYVVVILAAASMAVQISSVVLGLSAVLGLVLGFGMQDSFNNIAAGVWIASLRPIDKDEVVEVSGMKGKVSGVGLLATELITPDNQFLTIPNKIVWGSPVVNYSRMPIRRVDVGVGIGYTSPLDKAIEIAMEIMKNHDLVLDDPEPSVVVTELADSSVNLQLRPWAETANYWDVKNSLTKKVLQTYNEQDIEIPFPQLDVHMQE